MDMNNMKHKHSYMSMLWMYVIIIALTIAKQILFPSHDHAMHGMQSHGTWSSHALMYDFMGIMFVISSAMKLYNLKLFAASYASYDLIAKHIKMYAFIYPFIELGAGLAYLLRWQLMPINWLVLLIMTINSISIAIVLFKRNHHTCRCVNNCTCTECACMGVTTTVPVGWMALIENVLMAAMAVMMLYM